MTNPVRLPPNVVMIHSMTDIHEYESWLWGQGLGTSTIQQRVRFAQARLREWGRLDVTPERVSRWLGGYHGWTRRTYHSSLLSLFTWAVESGRMTINPVSRITRPPSPRPRPRPLTPDEQCRVLDGTTGNLRVWLLLGMRAGLRRFEIAKLRGEEVTAASLRFVGKGGQVGVVPMHPDLWESLELMPRSGWLFPSPFKPGQPITSSAIDQAVRKRFRSVGVDGGIHRTRATYGTELLRNGNNIRVVQELLRHRSLAATEHYVLAEQDELVHAIRSLGAA